jgi:uncharacterized membrane protein YsdA (DUF1294 family)
LLKGGLQMISDLTFAYLMLVNAAGLILMGWDKFMAKMGKTRIPEKILFLTAIVGGSIGVWLGMQIFRHKTRHAQFKVGIPLIIILQIAAVLLLKYYR